MNFGSKAEAIGSTRRGGKCIPSKNLSDMAVDWHSTSVPNDHKTHPAPHWHRSNPVLTCTHSEPPVPVRDSTIPIN